MLISPLGGVTEKYNPGFWKVITDFLYVINSNFCPISYRFWVISDLFVDRKWRHADFSARWRRR